MYVNGNKNVKNTSRGVNNKICKRCSVQVGSAYSATNVLEVLMMYCPSCVFQGLGVQRFSFVFVSWNNHNGQRHLLTARKYIEHAL